MTTRYLCTRDLRPKDAPLIKTRFTSLGDWRAATSAVKDTWVEPPCNILLLAGWRLADGSFVEVLYLTEDEYQRIALIEGFARARA